MGWTGIARKRHRKGNDTNTIVRYATAAALTGALALAAATPSEARNGRNAAAIGFGVGAVAGAAIAGSAYSNGYYGEPGYAYGYAPGYGYDSYAYEPAPAYGYGYTYAPAYNSGYGYDNYWQDPHRTNNFSINSQR